MNKIENKMNIYSNDIKKLNTKFGNDHMTILNLIKGSTFDFNSIITNDKFNEIKNLSEVLKDMVTLNIDKLQNDVINSTNIEINDNFLDFLTKYFIKKRTFYLYVYVLIKNIIDSQNNLLLESIKNTDNKEEINTIVDKIKEENSKKLKEYNRFIEIILPKIVSMQKST